MNTHAPASLAQQIAAVQQWWREAGVDRAYSDEVQIWAGEEAPPADAPQAQAARPISSPPVKPAAPPEPRMGGSKECWPQDIASFAQWWITEPSLASAGAMPRIAPRGPAGAKLMVLIPEPEAADNQTLLAGPHGRLLASFLSAAGISADECYFASALPRHTPAADWAELARKGLGEILVHHIRLARPQRLLSLGDRILPLFGHDPAQRPAFLNELNQKGLNVPVLFTMNLEMMLARPASRARFWQQWLDWTDC